MCLLSLEDVIIPQEQPGDELRDAQIVETAESHPSESNDTPTPDTTEEPVAPVHEEITTGSESEGRVEQSTQEEPRRSTRVKKPPERFEEQSC